MKSEIAARRKTSPLFLAVIIVLQLAVSLAGMTVLNYSFNFGKRCVLLHVSLVVGLVAFITLGLGLSVRSRRVRENRLAKFLLICVPAAGFATLIFLYLANYISNARWGNNFNYQVVGQWQLGAEIFGQGQPILSRQVYFSLALGVVAILGIYWGLSKRIFRGLEELFLPGRPYSLWRNSRRSLSSLALITIVAVGFGIYLFLLARSVDRVEHLMDEPIIGFFKTDTDSREDLKRHLAAPILRAQEERQRRDYPPNQSFSRKNVIVIMVDSLRPDHMQVYGYARATTPFLASLYAAGHLKRVDFVLATCPYTSCGVMSTLASKTLPSLIPESFKLHELLFDQGYRVNFILAGNHSWYNLKQSYGKSITYFFDGTNSSRYTANDDRVILEGLETIPVYAGTPSFFYFHLMSPHYIGFKQDRFRVYNPSQIEGTWAALVSGTHDAATKTNNYDNGVLQADATIEQIFQNLKEKGYLNESLAVILSDHGEGLGERGPDYYSHTLTLYQEFIRIPLLIYDTSTDLYPELKFARQVDVAPTILQRLGLLPPNSWQGRSLIESTSLQYSYHETRRHRVPIYAVIEWSQATIYKYIRSGPNDEELYELVSDPRESRNLIRSGDPEITGRLKAKLAEYLSR